VCTTCSCQCVLLYIFPSFQSSRIILKLIDPGPEQVSYPQNEVITPLEEKSKLELTSPCTSVDYSNLFGEEFKMLDEQWDCSYLNVLDFGAVEEGILHVLYSCAAQVRCNQMLYNSLVSILLSNFAVFYAHCLTICSLQPVLCSKMAERVSEFWAVLPLVQALLPG
jgi:hypothetical protein